MYFDYIYILKIYNYIYFDYKCKRGKKINFLLYHPLKIIYFCTPTCMCVSLQVALDHAQCAYGVRRWCWVFYSSLPYVLIQGLSMDLELTILLDWPYREGPPSPNIMVTVSQSTDLYRDAEELNSGPHICPAMTLANESFF